MTLVAALAGGLAAVVALIGYFGTWWVIGHEPLLKRHCHCREPAQ